MPEKARITIITRLVELESRLFALRFPASGSLYYTKDLQARSNKIDIPTAYSARESRFCIGPDTTFGLWYGKRHSLQVYRGPCMYQPYHLHIQMHFLSTICFEYPHSTLAIVIKYPKDTDPAAALTAGAKKEIAYLMKFGRPLHPFQRLRREIYNYQKQSHLEHLDSLDKYLRIVPLLIPNGNDTLTRPTIRHPDLQPNNVFVLDNLEITGLIDWQHCAILPLFLQCGIPNSLQNYGDSVSESLTPPELPRNFDELSEREQFKQVVLLRRRQLHYFYVAMTAKLNSTHYDALTYNLSTLRRKLFHHASDPWEGDNVTLKADLIQLTKNWSKINSSKSSTSSEARPPCPITFPEDEVSDCLRLDSAQVEADEQLEACRDIVGVGPEGWVPSDQYEEAKQRESKLKVDALDAAESDEERARLCEHWVFDDFNEEEYS
jgi:hypothetical protein